MIRSVCVLLFTWVYMLVASIPGLPAVLVLHNLSLIYAEARLGIRMLLGLAGVRIIEHGREHLPRRGAALYMANHQSNLDPPILFFRLPGYISVLAKQELFRIPLLGLVFKVGGLIPVDRSNREAAIASIDKAVTALKGGRPFLIFPEGTRSPDGRLLVFKKGPFFMASQAGVPIIPITISGTRERMRKGSIRMYPGEVHVHYHAPVKPGEYATREELIAAVRQTINSALPEEVRG